MDDRNPEELEAEKLEAVAAGVRVYVDAVVSGPIGKQAEGLALDCGVAPKRAHRMLLSALSAACKRELGGDLDQGAWPEFQAMKDRVAKIEAANAELQAYARKLEAANAKLAQVCERQKEALTQAKAREQRARLVKP